MKYLLTCLLFLANSEVISAAALLIMMGMFLWDIAAARVGMTPINDRRYEKEVW